MSEVERSSSLAEWDVSSKCYNKILMSFTLSILGNERLQEMMQIMVEERGGRVFPMDERYSPLIIPSPLGTDV